MFELNEGPTSVHLSSPIERPDRKIIQKRIVIQNHQNYQIGKGNFFIFFFYQIQSLSNQEFKPKFVAAAEERTTPELQA